VREVGWGGVKYVFFNTVVEAEAKTVTIKNGKPRSMAGSVVCRRPGCVGRRLLDFSVSGALGLAFHFKRFELVFIVMSVALVVKHADQQVLLVDIPDVNPMAQRFV